MSSQPPGIPGARVLQEVGLLTMRLSVAEEQIGQLQQQNAALAKQLREALEENAKLKHVPETTVQEAAGASN